MIIVDCIRRNKIQSARLRDDAMWSRRREKNSEQLGRAGKECMSNTMMAGKLQNICMYMRMIHIDAQKLSKQHEKNESRAPSEDSPVWNTHSPATLLSVAPKLMPWKALPSLSSKTALDTLDGASRPAGSAQLAGAAGNPFPAPLLNIEGDREIMGRAGGAGFSCKDMVDRY